MTGSKRIQAVFKTGQDHKLGSDRSLATMGHSSLVQLTASVVWFSWKQHSLPFTPTLQNPTALDHQNQKVTNWTHPAYQYQAPSYPRDFFLSFLHDHTMSYLVWQVTVILQGDNTNGLATYTSTPIIADPSLKKKFLLYTEESKSKEFNFYIKGVLVFFPGNRSSP